MDWKIKYGLVGLVFGVVMIFLSLDIFSYLKEPIVVTKENVKMLKEGDHVKIDVKISAGAAISETTTETKNGKTVSSKESSRYYLIPYINDNLTYWEYFITAKVKSDDFTSLERASDAFEAWWNNPTTSLPDQTIITLDGIIKKMNDEEKKYVKSYLENEPKIMDPIYIGINQASSVKLTSILAIVFFLAGGLLLFFGIKGAVKNKKAIEEARRNNAGYYSAPQNATFNNGAVDFNNAPNNFNNGPVNFNNGPVNFNNAPQNGNFNEVAPAPVETMNFNEVPVQQETPQIEAGAPQIESQDPQSDNTNIN